MLRCSRLIEKAIKQNGHVYVNKMDIQPGDRMTGWEIIAGLPLEEQRTWFEVEKGLNKVLGWEISQFDIFNFEALYEYDGNQWMEVKE